MKTPPKQKMFGVVKISLEYKKLTQLFALNAIIL